MQYFFSIFGFFQHAVLAQLKISDRFDKNGFSISISMLYIYALHMGIMSRPGLNIQKFSAYIKNIMFMSIKILF